MQNHGDDDIEKGTFCQVDANLDSNPKIRNAGRDGRDVFEFVLRVNAQRGFHGWIPLAYLRPKYLADLLMMSTDEARHGVTASVTAELLWVDQDAGQVHIVGWSPQWGKAKKIGKTDAERAAEYRTRKKLKVQLSLPSGDTASRDVTDRHVTRHAESQRHARGEERRVEERIRDQPTHPAFLSLPFPDPDGGGRDLDQHPHAPPYQPPAPVPAVLGIVVPSPEQVARTELGTETWARMNRTRQELAGALGLPTPPILHPMLEGRSWLAERIRESGPRAKEDLDHVFAVQEGEARTKKELQWIGPTMFGAKGWQYAMSKSVPAANPWSDAEHSSAMLVLERLSKASGITFGGSASHVNLVVNRLRDGLTENDLRKIIAYCADEWEGNPKMRQHLRPETLFGAETHTRYIDQARALYPEKAVQ